MQDKILDIVWENGRDFNEIKIRKGHPELRVDLRILFLIYGHHKSENFPVNRFGYGCWNGGAYTSTEARFVYGAFDPSVVVKIPDFPDESPHRMNSIDFSKLCLNGRKTYTRKIR